MTMQIKSTAAAASATARADLSGKHALVTGGAQGIGASIARALLAQGASVTIAGRTAASLQAAVLTLQAEVQAGARLDYVVLDVSDAAGVELAVAKVHAAGGAIDILINNAGQAAAAPFLKTDAELWQRMLDVNLSGSFHCTQAVLPAMLQAGWGRIVNVVSTAGLTGYAYVAAYCAAKHGVIGLTRALALELATKGITVNAVCPGYTETDLLQQAVQNIVEKTGRSEQQARAELAAANPQRRLVQPDEVANAVLWLCLPQSAAMNGQSIAVAGGELL
ncbi:SDR family NAD(P)-dependent oxidoreductase [Undibacterium sp. Ren11W]|uniref:SDR family NAD(P)-dependent oxidoreductase n=1 Tax=Undibacterium sp. Ren11W TaxID=3413045 RepID=UPI003BF17E28